MNEIQRVHAVVSVPVTEMQARFNEVLFAQPAQVICVTYQGSPVAALLPRQLYHWFRSVVQKTDEATEASKFVVTSKSITQVKYLFYSYSQRLAPALLEMPSGALEITKNRQLVGAVVAWSMWKQYQEADVPDHLLLAADSRREGGTFTIATIRHRLFAIAEQFERERAQGILRPIVVTNRDDSTFVIVPWRWYQIIIEYVKLHTVTPFRILDEGIVVTDKAGDREQVRETGDFGEITDEREVDLDGLGSQ